jgi:L-amino acid N-acyltransferase YncA
MDFIIRKAKDSDAADIAKIFNYYVENGTAAFFDEPVDQANFYGWLKTASCNDAVYAVENAGKIAGFGVLKQFYDRRVFKNTAEPGYFLFPGFTGKGAGGKLYDVIEKDARNIGIKNLLVSISSKNEKSIYFHSKRGFVECGKFRRVGNKKGTEFDMVWMQKFL